jgi:hypothetical protein
VTSDQVTSEKDDEQYYRSYNLKWNMPFEFERLQFPVRLAFAMTLNKAQGHRYKCVNEIWKIHAPQMDNFMWLAHALENLPIYSCTHQKKKQKIL